MKKLLLTLAAAALTSGAAMAGEYVLTPTGISNSTVAYTSNEADTPDFVITAVKNSGSTAPAYNANSKDLRVYADGTLTIAAPAGVTITEIQFEISAQGKKRQTTLSVNVGEMTEESLGVAVWQGSDETIAFTVGAKATIGTEGATKAGQLDFTSMTVITEEGGSTLEPAGLSFEKDQMTVDVNDEVVANVLANPHDLAITWTSTDESVATVDAEGNVTLVGEGTTTIIATSEATDTYKAGKAEYILNVIKMVKASSIAEMLDIIGEDASAEITVNFDMTVTYVNGAYTYVTDGKDFTLLYLYDLGYKELDIIPAGWQTTYKAYNGLDEFIPVKASMEAATKQGTFTPREVTPAEVNESMVNEVVIIKEVEFEEDTPSTATNFTGSGLTFRNTFKLPSVKAGKTNLKAVVSYYNGLQIVPIQYDVEVGVETIEAVEGEAAYFNLQGVRVANPENGLYIKVANGKATKVLVK